MTLWLSGVILSVLFGTFLGSVVSLLVVRMKDASTSSISSYCPQCRVELRPHHLVPILSWLIMGGRCEKCHRPVRPQYPVVEAIGGALALITFLRWPWTLSISLLNPFLFEMAFIFCLMVLVTFDWRWKLLPLEFMYGSTALFLLWNVALMRQPFGSVLLGMGFGFLALWIQVVLSRGRAMGSGDPWMGAMIGAVIAWPNMVFSYYVTYMLGGVVAAGLLLFQRADRRTRIAFGPLLAIGGLVALWFGNVAVTLVLHALNRA